VVPKIRSPVHFKECGCPAGGHPRQEERPGGKRLVVGDRAWGAGLGFGVTVRIVSSDLQV
jgi:hypothetical protein